MLKHENSNIRAKRTPCWYIFTGTYRSENAKDVKIYWILHKSMNGNHLSWFLSLRLTILGKHTAFYSQTSFLQLFILVSTPFAGFYTDKLSFYTQP
jgi:hypothetical protein